MCGYEAIRLEDRVEDRLRGPSCESPSKCHLHVAHVFLLSSASLTTFVSPLRPRQHDLNIHNSTHGSGACYGTCGKLVKCDEPFTGYDVVLGTSDANWEWAKRLAQSRLLVRWFHFAQEKQSQSCSLCARVRCLAVRLRVATTTSSSSRSLPDLWETVTGTFAQPFSMQCAVWCYEVMQVVALYNEDRSVNVRHVTEETMSCTAVTDDRNAIKLVSLCLDDGSVLRAETTKDMACHSLCVSHCFRLESSLRGWTEPECHLR